MICIVGRSGSGKDYLANEFAKLGYKVIKSYTTRPKRNENEDTHIFITPEEAKTFTDKVAETTINGYEYFATFEQVKNNDIYIIDPEGLKPLTKNINGREPIYIIYVYSDFDERKEKAISRSADKEKELEVFMKRHQSEDEQFCQFEECIELNKERYYSYYNSCTAFNSSLRNSYDNGNYTTIVDCTIYNNKYDANITKAFMLYYLMYKYKLLPKLLLKNV